MIDREALLDRWLATAQPGDRLVYFRGESLAAARRRDAALDRVAERLDRLSTVGRRLVMSSCHHPRFGYDGARFLSLSQARESAGSAWFVYAATMLPPPAEAPDDDATRSCRELRAQLRAAKSVPTARAATSPWDGA